MWLFEVLLHSECFTKQKSSRVSVAMCLEYFLCVCRVMAVPATVIYFTCYDQLRDFLRSGLGLQGSFVPLVAGGLARRKSVFVFC